MLIILLLTQFLDCHFRSTSHVSVGNQKRGQNVTFCPGHNSEKDIFHDLFHVLGRYHEHQRPDRDNYVFINWDNIMTGTEENFNR